MVENQSQIIDVQEEAGGSRQTAPMGTRDASEVNLTPTLQTRINPDSSTSLMGLNNEKSITPIKQNEDDREG